MIVQLPNDYILRFSLWHSDVMRAADLGYDDKVLPDADEIEEYMSTWTPGQQIPRKIKVAIMMERLQAYDDAITQLAQRLANEEIDVSTWEEEMQRQIKRLHLHASVAGRSGDWSAIDSAAVSDMNATVREQLRYLRRWSNELAGVEKEISARQVRNRGRLYGQASSQTFEKSHDAEKGIPQGILPAYPGDGTTLCLTNCKCRWSFRVINKENGDFDCNWRLGAAEHCQTCRDRARSWLGLRIRDGELVTDVEPIFVNR